MFARLEVPLGGDPTEKPVILAREVQMAMLGIGHPNLILYTDYAEVQVKGGQPTWFLKVETYVEIEESQVQMVKDGLASTDPKVRKDLAKYLHKQVPNGGKPDASKRMISDALEVSYP